jgi:arsenite-transporting ATPase
VKRLHFFIGKGGVGKTTLSAAYAVRTALQHPKEGVLLLSTDPAHSLADVLQRGLEDEPTRIKLPAGGKLDAWQINSEKLFSEFLRNYKDKMLDLIDKGSIFSRSDIEPLITTALPGMAEMSALLAIRDALGSQKYSQVVVDTAPFGHTLRLFTLPEQFVRFLDFLELAASRDQVLAQHFGGRRSAATADLVTEFRDMVEEIQNATSRDGELVLVTTAEKFSLNESLRCTESLANQSPPLKIAQIVLNRVITGRRCKACAGASASLQQARKFLETHFPATPKYLGEDPGGPIMGPAALASFAEHVFAGKRLKYDVPSPRSRAVRLERTTWPALDVPLSLVLGKGGVGKTTVSAALGFNTRHLSEAPVEICSVDPAPSLDDIFQTEIGSQSQPVLGDPEFRASEMDAVSLFHDWIGDLQTSVEESTTSEVSGIHVDLSFERQLLSKLLEIVPPGVDEVLAIFRIMDLLGNRDKRVVIDMAPTGHALELLRMPERILAWTRPLLKTLAVHRTLAFARNAGAKIAELNHRVRELSDVLKSSRSTEIHAVMLAEPLPDRETERLLAEIRSQKLPLKRVFVNRVILDGSTCRRCKRARQWQQATLAQMKKAHPETELLVIRNFPHEIAGKAALRSFTGELWRVS